ncbi:MAG: helix-turn-helix domain-containing protein [Thermoplasmatales archaeon]|jgi:putative transcriptional regulator|nr:helix-turn-helix domain-containing protein [Thermoplasmatales archaeon]
MAQELEEKMAGEMAMSADPGKTMRKWREEFDLSQSRVADAMGVSCSVISDYESGRRKSPGVAFVRKFVGTLLDLDREVGSPTISKYMPKERDACIIAMAEFREGISISEFVKAVNGVYLAPAQAPEKKVYGYTILDSLKAIMNLKSEDYVKIYGWSTDRVLIFTDVHYGRSPMVAIRAHPLTPAMVMYQKPDRTDELAIRLAKLEGIPLASTDMEAEDMIRIFDRLEEGM